MSNVSKAEGRVPLIHLSRRIGISPAKAWGIRILAFVIGMIACGKEAAPTEAPTEAPTQAPTEAPTQATESKPIQAVNGGTPISTGSGCATSSADAAE